MQRWTIVFLFVLAAVAGAAAVFFYRQNQSLRRLIAALNVQGTPALSPPRVESGPSPTSEAELSSAEVAQTPVLTETPAPRRARTSEDRFEERRGRGMEAMSRVLTDPDARAAMLARFKTTVDRQYGDLFVKLGLDEVQVETLRTLLAERQLAQMESGLLARSAETDEDRDGARAWRDSKLESLDAGVAAILGPDGSTLLREYVQSAPQRSAVEDINRRASYLGAPLDSAQSDRLVAAIRSVEQEHPIAPLESANTAGQRWREDGRGSDAVAITQQFVDATVAQKTAQNQAILTQARTFLTDPQLEALADKQLEEMEALQQRLNFQIRNPDLAGPMMGGPGGSGGRGFGDRPPRGGNSGGGG